MTHYKKAISWGSKVFLIQALPITLLIGLNYLQSTVIPQSPLAWAFYLMSLVGHYGLILLLAYFFLFLPFVFLIKGQEKLVRSWFLLLIIIGSFLHLIDSFIYAQYRYHFNAFILDLLFGGAAGDIFEFSVFSQALLFGLIISAAAILWIWGKKIWETTELDYKSPKLLLFSILFLSLIGSHGLHVYGEFKGMRPITKLAANFPLYMPLTGKKFLKKRGFIEENFPLEGHLNDFQYPLNQLSCNQNQNPNILFIVIDSWRFDELNQDVTPNIYRLSKNGITFGQHFSGSNNTRGGIFNIFYGMPSTYWDVALQTQTSPVLISELLKRDYLFGIFSSAALNSPEFHRTVFTKVPNLRVTTEGFRANDRDLKINQDWKRWIQSYVENKSERPFFGFMFYDSPHAYKFPKDYPIKFIPNHDLNYLALNNDTDPLPVFNRHRNSVHFVDGLIQEVISDLEKKHLLEKTIVVITSDHGQEFNDYKKNYWGHNSNFGAAQMHVPFVLLWPGQSPQYVTAPTSHYDIAPTFIKDIFGCTNPASDYSFGSSLLSPKSDEGLIVGTYLNYGIIDRKEKLVTVINPVGSYDVLDLQLNEISRERVRNKLVVDSLNNLNRFFKK